MTLHIIVASEIGSDIHEQVHLIIENEANLQYIRICNRLIHRTISSASYPQ